MMKTSHIFLLIATVLIWGVNFTVIKIGLEHFPPIFLNALRFLVIGMFIFIIPRPKVGMAKVVAIGLCFGVVYLSLLFLGMNFGVAAGVSSVTLQCQVFFTILICAVAFGEKVTWPQILGICCGAVGLSIILNDLSSEPSTVTGLLFIIAAGFAWAVTNSILRTTQTEDALAIVVWSGAVAFLPLLIISIIFEDTDNILASLHNITLTGAGSVFYLSVISTVFAFAIWGKMLSIYKAAQVVPFALMVPVFGFMSGALFLGEELLPGTLFGAAFVLGGIAIGQFSGHPKVRRFFRMFGGG